MYEAIVKMLKACARATAGKRVLYQGYEISVSQVCLKAAQIIERMSDYIGEDACAEIAEEYDADRFD